MNKINLKLKNMRILNFKQIIRIKLILVVITCQLGVFSLQLQAQNIGINTTGATPDASAGLDIDYPNKGLLIPRVSLTQTTSNAPIGAGIATSLMVYNTTTINDVTPGYYYWDGIKWVRILNTGNSTGLDWSLTGNAGTNPATNFIGTTDNQDWVIRTNNVEKIRVMSAGSVGIGTSSPIAKLHVESGDIAARSNTANSIHSIAYGTTASAGPTFVGSRGRGTIVAPANSLSGDVLAKFIGRDGFTTIPAVNPGMHVFSSQNHSAGNLGADLRFFTVANGTTTDVERMRVTHDGNVGIGTSAPTVKLEVQTSATQSLGVGNGAPTEWGLGMLKSGVLRSSLFFDETVIPNNMYMKTYGAYPIQFLTNNNQRMIINAAGDVGIGTVSPIVKLHVLAGDIAAQSASTLQYAALGQDGCIELYRDISSPISPNHNGYIDFKHNFADDNRFRITWNNTLNVGGGGLEFLSGTGPFPVTNTSRMVILNNGRVGIGTTAPTVALHIVGDVCWTGTAAACSDVRYKKDITQLTSSLENVMQLKGVNYYWKTEEFPDQKFPTTKQLGFIAQDIEKFYPEVVLTDDNGYKSVDYSRLTPILVEAIKELKTKIDTLEFINSKQFGDMQNIQLELDQIKEALNLKASK